MKFGWFIGGIIIGGIATSVTLASTGWMVSSSLAETMQENAVHDALKERLAAICVAQFEARAKNPDAIVDDLMDQADWQRGDYVASHGWATMPGRDGSERFVANECAERILSDAS